MTKAWYKQKFIKLSKQSIDFYFEPDLPSVIQSINKNVEDEVFNFIQLEIAFSKNGSYKGALWTTNIIAEFKVKGDQSSANIIFHH